MRFRDIKPYTRSSHYQIDVSWEGLEDQLQGWDRYYGLDLSPDFQRAHVWTRVQQSRYVEHILKQGKSGRDLYFNCPNWQGGGKCDGPMVLVDGKQRLEAVQRFLANKLRAFGAKLSEYDGPTDWIRHTFKFHVNDLATRAEVLQWYLDMNAGGTPHKKSEIEKVREMLRVETSINTSCQED